MFYVDEKDIKMIFDFFNELNKKFDTEEKLNWYIQNQYPEYYKKSKKRLYSECFNYNKL